MNNTKFANFDVILIFCIKRENIFMYEVRSEYKQSQCFV